MMGSATHPVPREQEFQGSPVLGVSLDLCLHPLMQNDQFRHGNTYGEGHVFKRSETPLYLHKYVIQFVSNI